MRRASVVLLRVCLVLLRSACSSASVASGDLPAALRGQDPRACPGNADVVNAVADGQVPFGLVNQHYLYERPPPSAT